MSLSGKAACLMGEGMHRGTAWLISQEYALTALHCVQDNAGIEYSNLNLIFSSFSHNFSVTVVRKVKEMDVVLLKVQKHEYGDLPVIPLSRRVAEPLELCRMHGYPESIKDALPNGISVKGKIETLEEMYKGNTKKLDCKALQIGDLNISTYQGSSNLQGLSGGVMVSDDQTTLHALGVVIEEQLSGSFIYVVPIIEIATKIPEVHAVIQSSNYINPQDHRSYVSVSADGENILWSSSISPDQVDRLWKSLLDKTSADDQTNIKEFHISASLRDLKSASQALVRLCAYSDLQAIYVPDSDYWQSNMEKLREQHRFPCHDLSLKLYQTAVTDMLPSTWIETPIKNFADIIHQVLDRSLLYWLDEQLYKCLNFGKDTEIGCDIKPELRQEMLEHWSQWHSLLKTTPELWQCYLIRVFSLDSQCKGLDGVLMSIGATPQIQQQLLHATLYALALCAAGVHTIPQLSEAGNLSVYQQSGHVCGIERSHRKRIDMIVNSQEWNTKVVIFPYLNQQLLKSYEFAVPFTSVEGSKGNQLQNLPPIAITGDTDFLKALEKGKLAVKQYYDERSKDIDQILSTYQLPTRTELLDV